MKLCIYTRDVVNSQGETNLEHNTILRNQMDKILRSNEVMWIVLISNSEGECIQVDRNKRAIFVKCKLSTSQARHAIFNYIVSNNLKFDYFMNMDSDDIFIDADRIIELTNIITEVDLLGYGLKVSDGFGFTEWDFSSKLISKYKRYSTVETQKAFLFLHSYKVIKILLNGRYFTPKSVDSIGYPDDTSMAIDVALYNRNNPGDLKIGILQGNLITYLMHEGQDSKTQVPWIKDFMTEVLHDFGDLYANVNEYFRFNKYNKLEKFNPYEIK